jgi:hypothetical protein
MRPTRLGVSSAKANADKAVRTTSAAVFRNRVLIKGSRRTNYGV